MAVRNVNTARSSALRRSLIGGVVATFSRALGASSDSIAERNQYCR